MDEAHKVAEELLRTFQYHTAHNVQPPSPDEPFGKVRVSPEIERAISEFESVEV